MSVFRCTFKYKSLEDRQILQTCHPTPPEVPDFSSFNAPGGGGVTFMTSLMVEPTTIIFTPLETLSSRNVLPPSLTSPEGKKTNKI